MAGTRAQESLWAKAIDLPNAQRRDFFSEVRRPDGVPDEHLKVIRDTQLRARLIQAGLAEGIQSPKGRRRGASIIRLYPDGDAPIPRKGPPRSRVGRQGGTPGLASSSSVTRVTRNVRASGVASLDEFDLLLQRIEVVEAAVALEFRAMIDETIARVKRDLAILDGIAFDRAFSDLQEAMAARKALAPRIREEAFRRIESETAFPPGRLLRFISPHTR